MKRASLAALAALLLLLPACGAPEPEPTPTPTPTPVATPTPEPTPTPYNGPVSPLSGLPMGEEWVNRRPVAVMLNNLKEALPQLGQSMADIIYEVPAEGGITRMLGCTSPWTGWAPLAPSAPPGPITWSWPWAMTPSSSTPGAAWTPMTKSASGGCPPWTR